MDGADGGVRDGCAIGLLGRAAEQDVIDALMMNGSASFEVCPRWVTQPLLYAEACMLYCHQYMTPGLSYLGKECLSRWKCSIGIYGPCRAEVLVMAQDTQVQWPCTLIALDLAEFPLQTNQQGFDQQVLRGVCLIIMPACLSQLK